MRRKIPSPAKAVFSAGERPAGSTGQENKERFVHETPAAEPAAVKRARAKLKIFLPGQIEVEEGTQGTFFAGLPEEYGENAVIIMAVDPNTAFVDWEILPGEIAGREGTLVLRFYDVSGIQHDGTNAVAALDVPITKRVGNGFFAIRLPGKDVIVEAGIIGPEGAFHAIVRSEIASFPGLLEFDELGILQKLFASDFVIGY